MGTRKPAVSICIPAYQAEAHLDATLRHVLAQPDPDLEILVLDNASTDRTAQIVADYTDPRLRVERNPNVLRLPDNWNRAVELSRGALVKVVCADDLIRGDAIARQRVVLERDPGVAVVASRRHLIDDDGQLMVTGVGLRGLLGRLPARSVVRSVVRSGGNPIGEGANVLFRRSDFDRVGGFDGRLVFPMDLDLWIRLLRGGDFVGQETALAAFRISTSSLSHAASERQYREQRVLTERTATDPHWRVPAADRWMARARAPLARARRRALFRIAGWARG